MSHQAALDSLGKMTRVLKAFEDAELVLRTLAGVEQNERELRAAVDRARAEMDAISGDLVAAKDAVKKARADAKRLDDAAQEKAQALIDEATNKAANIIEKADAKSAAADKHVADATVKLNALVSEQEIAQARLDDVLTKLASARAQVANLLG